MGTSLQVNSLPGKARVGDLVESLHKKRAVRGRVTLVKKGRIYVTGAHYEGGPEVKASGTQEDWAILERANKGEDDG